MQLLFLIVCVRLGRIECDSGNNIEFEAYGLYQNSQSSQSILFTEDSIPIWSSISGYQFTPNQTINYFKLKLILYFENNYIINSLSLGIQTECIPDTITMNSINQYLTPTNKLNKYVLHQNEPNIIINENGFIIFQFEFKNGCNKNMIFGGANTFIQAISNEQGTYIPIYNDFIDF